MMMMMMMKKEERRKKEEREKTDEGRLEFLPPITCSQQQAATATICFFFCPFGSFFFFALVLAALVWPLWALFFFFLFFCRPARGLPPTARPGSVGSRLLPRLRRRELLQLPPGSCRLCLATPLLVPPSPPVCLLSLEGFLPQLPSPFRPFRPHSLGVLPLLFRLLCGRLAAGLLEGSPLLCGLLFRRFVGLFLAVPFQRQLVAELQSRILVDEELCQLCQVHAEESGGLLGGGVLRSARARCSDEVSPVYLPFSLPFALPFSACPSGLSSSRFALPPLSLPSPCPSSYPSPSLVSFPCPFRPWPSCLCPPQPNPPPSLTPIFRPPPPGLEPGTFRFRGLTHDHHTTRAAKNQHSGPGLVPFSSGGGGSGFAWSGFLPLFGNRARDRQLLNTRS